MIHQKKTRGYRKSKIVKFRQSMLALILAFALQQVKTKCRSGVTQAQGY